MSTQISDLEAWQSDLDLLELSSRQLIDSIAAMSDADVAAESGLPGWSRGHVLAHLEGNARGLGRLARWARDGIERPMYISRAVRDSDVELHSDRSRVRHQASVSQSIDALADDLAILTALQRESTVVLGNGVPVLAASLARHRLQEVCVHHADLNVAGYAWRDWPASMAERMIALVTEDFAAREDFPVASVVVSGHEFEVNPGDTSVSGSAPEILAWLIGRDNGAMLTVEGLASVPDVPAWR